MQPEIPFLSVFSSMKRLMRYSLGSVALGSLTVSFVESIRFLLESIRRKLKGSSHMPDSWIDKAAYQSSQCFQRCIEWTIKSVNRNAYIMVIFINLPQAKFVCIMLINICMLMCSYYLTNKDILRTNKGKSQF